MTQPRTIEGRQFSSYIESTTRPNSSASEVFVGNTAADSIPVITRKRGVSKFIYNEILSVGTETTEILSVTVPLLKGFDLSSLSCSGDNIAKYILTINSNVVEVKRTIYLDYNAVFELNNFTVNAGDVVKLLVENKTNESALFEATLKYNEFDE